MNILDVEQTSFLYESFGAKNKPQFIFNNNVKLCAETISSFGMNRFVLTKNNSYCSRCIAENFKSFINVYSLCTACSCALKSKPQLQSSVQLEIICSRRYKKKTCHSFCSNATATLKKIFYMTTV